MDTALAERLAAVDEGIAASARAAGRDPGGITRIVVTKFHPARLVTDLYDLGVRDVGENRQQELSAKATEVGALPGLKWHFIGQAQTNKARAIRAVASAVHSVDRARLADSLDAAAPEEGDLLDVLVQVNLTDDTGRGGVAPGEAESLAAHVAGCPTLRLRGVMAVAPLDEQPARAFERLRGAAEAVRRVVPDADWISAGMTGDYPEAVAMGATHLRIGSAITGPRPVRG
ncbi:MULTISPECIES: YggS family pyridoxal phosphate-dependent enzyme [Microbacterium]|uniref:Pyridoxal phosphate homeostasis protein n=1 Tax=Microbacterium wangchenii TaxID=2541726 RepID=A0ABX5SQP0_9MICO|nr:MULTISPECIES: YggS family pyridoxal phosphate-dependent enzyme [Microbacterium]MCK6064990.1 YggS family pyridoxal phosphate-dependent enzyme [Microbacterium sp. EYE_512]QBR88463.1 YggS family pyridoxal phosphate-dependent enzyme [Microbacterium wangchenii]TFV82484.1 YggS family pyridoxal phosphate-dependent enzyme [Microbacterium sp. dk485]TXK20190.1 YggS family pyridoxal phosphate-dependent enzyme [Microbacterium wangchenii]